MSRIDYFETHEFKKDLKKLLKSFRSLKEDLELVKKAAIELFHIRGIDNRSVFLIPGYDTAEIQVFKIKKFACKALKGKGVKSGIRVIYAFHQNTSTVEFIEIYFKKRDRMKEDKRRIKEYLKNNS